MSKKNKSTLFPYKHHNLIGWAQIIFWLVRNQAKLGAKKKHIFFYPVGKKEQLHVDIARVK